MDERLYQFEWDPPKAVANLRKHGVSFQLAATVFVDPGLLTVADLERSAAEERWFSIGLAMDGRMLSVDGRNPSRLSQRSGSFLRAARQQPKFRSTWRADE